MYSLKKLPICTFIGSSNEPEKENAIQQTGAMVGIATSAEAISEEGREMRTQIVALALN